MPELPEVETARSALQRACAGRAVAACAAADPADNKLFAGCDAASVCAAMLGATVTRVRRHGKHVWLELGSAGAAAGDGPSACCLFIHLGMTGAIIVEGERAPAMKAYTVDDGAAAWPPRHTRLHWALAGGPRVALTDPRRFGRVRLEPSGGGAAAGDVDADPTSAFAPLRGLGPDFLLSPPDVAPWCAALLRRRGSLKGALLDQALCCGIGNWVADEALYRARLHPESVCAEVAPGRAAALHAALAAVCAQAAAALVAGLDLPEDWLFNARWRGNSKAAVVHQGRAVAFVTVAGRTSAFLPSRLLPAGTEEEGGSGGGAPPLLPPPPSGGAKPPARKRKAAAQPRGSKGAKAAPTVAAL